MPLALADKAWHSRRRYQVVLGQLVNPAGQRYFASASAGRGAAGVWFVILQTGTGQPLAVEMGVVRTRRARNPAPVLFQTASDVRSGFLRSVYWP